ncbi:BolA family protein [Halomonas beimenensis]|uniref:BolA family protein n=1 Tax=Halomonas beimenensis TaxID=475662 RepID=UPI003617FCF0
MQVSSGGKREPHAQRAPNSETHFKVTLVSPAFEGQMKVKRHQPSTSAGGRVGGAGPCVGVTSVYAGGVGGQRPGFAGFTELYGRVEG